MRCASAVRPADMVRARAHASEPKELAMTSPDPFKVADLTLAEYGRKEILK